MERKRIGPMLLLAFLLLLLFAGTAAAAEPLGETERAYWGEGTGQAAWDAVKNARKYEVRLYENDRHIQTVTVTAHQADLSAYMSDGSRYTFAVRAVPNGNQEKKYSSGEWVYCYDELEASGIGYTEGRFRVYLDGKKYQLESGEYVTNQWCLIRGQWYYFNTGGYMQTGWQLIDNKYYYLGEDGVMRTGWQELDGAWYYLQADGSMYTGWLQTAPDRWYYLGSDGRMLKDTVVDGFRLDASGLRIS